MEIHHAISLVIGVPRKEEWLFVSPGEIIYIEALHNHSLIFTSIQKSAFISMMNLGDILYCIPSDHFCRVHKSYIVSLAHLRAMNRRKTRLFFPGDIAIPIGRSYLSTLLDKLLLLR